MYHGFPLLYDYNTDGLHCFLFLSFFFFRLLSIYLSFSLIAKGVTACRMGLSFIYFLSFVLKTIEERLQLLLRSRLGHASAQHNLSHAAF